MKKQGKSRMLSLVVVFALIINLISPVMVVFADNENIKLTLTTNKTKVESGEQVEFSLHYEALNGPGSIKDGDVITFELPDIFKDIKPKYPQEHFKDVKIDGTTFTAIFGEGANDAIGGYINIKATAKDVNENTTQRVEVNLNGTIQYIDIEVVKPEDNTSGGSEQPEVVDREIHKVVNNPNGYEGYEDGVLINNINNPVVGKKVKYTIYVNEKYAKQDNAYITDTMPEGMTLVKDSVKVYETQYGQAEKDVTDEFQSKMNLEDNSLYVNFGDTHFKYRVRYDVIINKSMPRYDNVVSLIKDNETSTSTAIVKPKDDERMFTKHSKTNETGKDENGNQVNIINMVGDKVKYTLDINPNNQKIENVVVEDVIPDGMKMVEGSVRVGAHDIAGDFEWVTDQMKDNIKFENNKLTVNIGDTNKHYQIYYDLEVTKREKAYNNKAKISYDNTSKEVNNVVSYEMNAGAINARKSVDKTNLKKGDSQIVNYTINFDCYGYFNKGYLNLTDKIDPRVQILDVEAPEHFTVNIDKDTNTINVTNDKKEIDYGAKLQVKIKTDFTNVDDGATIKNVAKINNSTTNIVETKKGYKFSAKKVDSDTKSPLEGATFELMDSNKKVIAKLNSDSEGVISSSIDKLGDYYLKEVKAPKGYALDSKEIKFTVDDSDVGNTINVGNIVNSKSNHSVIIKKVDASDGKKVLPGVEFEIQDLKGNKVTTVTTDSSGLASLNLLPGKYQAIEKKAPAGYTLNSKPVAFEVKLDDSSDINLVIKNNKTEKPGTGEPSKPEKPNIENPSKPDESEKPEKPNTENPSKPDESENTEDPNIGDPNNSGDLEKPEKPNIGDPNNSGDLEKPEKPNIGDPNNSGNLEKPEKPNTENPSKPGESDKSENQSTGNTSNQGESDKSENQSTENTSSQGKSDNPKTSDSGILPYIGLFVASTVGLAVNNNRRRK